MSAAGLVRAPVPDRKVAAAVSGLAIAWGGTALLISPAARALGEPAEIAAALVGQLLLWLLAASVLAIVLVWEREPLGSLWLRPFAWRSVVWGVLLVAANYLVFFPAGEWVRRTAALPGFAAGMETVMRFPLWFRLLAVIGAGVVEELLFRGFTVTRLVRLSVPVWLAATLTLIAFTGLHIPVWGWGFALGGLVSGAPVMAFFVWRRDLLAMIVFHTITDAVGLVIVPLYSDWWKTPALS